MKHAEKSKSIRMKTLLTVAAGLAAFLLSVFAVLSIYNRYIDGILYAERLNQMKEVTGQLFKGLEDVIKNEWNLAQTQVNTLIREKPETTYDMFALMKEQSVRGNMEQEGIDFVAVDIRGRYYTRDGERGLLPGIDYLMDEPERVSFVSNTMTTDESRMLFLVRLDEPVVLMNGQKRVELWYYGVSQSMTMLSPYFVCDAYSGSNGVFVLDTDGARLFDSGRTETITSYNVLNALSEKSYLHGGSFEEARQELEEKGLAYSNVVLDGTEHFYGLYQMEKAEWILLFVVPASFVAMNTVQIVNLTAQIITVFALLLLACVTAVVVFMLKRQQRIAVETERENNEALARANAELKRAMEATKSAFDAAEEASKSKSDFLANMSHDIRTPMNAIMGMTALIKHSVNDPAKVQEYIGKIELSSSHLLGLINDVLDMSKIESGKTELNNADFDIDDVITQLDTAFRPQTDARSQTFQIDAPKFAFPYLTGDNIRLMQVLNNILSNAVKYTPVGGTIRMEIEENPRESHKYNQLIFRVSDNGIGMSEEFQKHIFESFSREERSVTNTIQGTGLGMAIVKNIVDLMGGTIHVESRQGEGSTFEVALEFRIADAPEQLTAAQTVKDAVEISLKGMKFLCAEDNELNAEILGELLNMEGATCQIYENGRAIVDAFANVKPGDYDFILMDVQMPVMNGYEATQAIRHSVNPLGETIPIFAMTANAFSEDIQHSLDVGMDGHISKPVDMEKLKDTIRNFRAGGGKR